MKLNYGKACGFNDFKDIFEDLYFDTPENLMESNLKFIQCICNFLGITTRIIDSRNLDLIGNQNEGLVDACEKLGASIYLVSLPKIIKMLIFLTVPKLIWNS